MPIFKIAQGPWKLLLKGSLQDQLLEVYTNNAKYVYVQTLQEEKGQLTSGVCEFYKPYAATGDVAGFVQTLPREVLVISQHQKEETNTFLLLGSGPISLMWEENIVLEQTDILLKKLEVGSSLLMEVARAYDVQLKPLAEMDPTIADALFAMPLMVPLLSTNAHISGGGVQVSSVPSSPVGGVLPGEFVLGVTQNGLVVKEPVIFFKKTSIVNGRPEHRKHVIQVITEGSLFSNIPVVIVDWENEFAAMRKPNPTTKGLQEQKIDGDPLGFPLKEFLPVDNLKIQLSHVPPEAFVEILGLSGSELGDQFTRFLREHRVSSIDEAKGILNQLPANESLTPFRIASIIRLLSLLDQTYPNLFNGINPTEEISKNWFQFIGRVGVLRLQTVAPKFRNLLIYAVLKGIYEWYEQKGVSNRMRSLIVIPEVQHLFEEKGQGLLLREFERLFIESNAQDVGYVFSSPHDIDIPKSLQDAVEAKLSVITGKEVAVILAGRKNYRVTVRDTFSEPVVKQFFA